MVNEIIIFLIGIVVHEFGHFAHYLYKGYNPKFIWLWVGPAVEPTSKNIPVKDVMINILIAIFSGLYVLAELSASKIIIFAYITACFVDLANFQNLIIYIQRKTITLNTNINNIKVVVTKTPQ